MATANVQERPALLSMTAAQMGCRKRNELSELLAQAHALTHLLGGQFQIPEDKRPELKHRASVLEQILGMAREAENCSDAGVTSAETRGAVQRARSLCEVVYSDEAGDGRDTGDHLADDLAGWVLMALAEALESAKQAVDHDVPSRVRAVA